MVDKKVDEKAEIRHVVCRECGREIDEMGCVFICKYDNVNFAARDPKTLQVNVYVLTRVEPYVPKAKKKK